MEIDIEFSLQSVQGLDEKTGVLTSSAWVELSWVNEYYVWEPEYFGGIENIRMSPSKVWVPDIYVFNDASGEYNAGDGFEASQLLHCPRIMDPPCWTH